MGKIFYFDWEVNYLLWLQNLEEGSIVQQILLFLNNIFSACGEEMVCIVVLGFIYWGISKDKGKRLGLVIIMTFLSNCMIKNIFNRLRPYQSVDDIKLLRDVDGYSFPSGHSANSAALYPSLAYEFKNKKWLRVIAVALPILVAISRNYLGAHWPTDVIVGLLQGIVFFILVEYLTSKIKNEMTIYIIFLLVAAIGIFYCKTDDYFTALGLFIGFIFAILFEKKKVNFENTKKISICILRTVVGCLVYLSLNFILKLLLGNLFVEETFGYHMMKALRYAIVIFVLIGVYPMAFRFENKILNRKSHNDKKEKQP